MLRAYYLACDFYPKILFAGDKPDLFPLLDTLDEFIDFHKEITLHNRPLLQLWDFTLTLVPDVSLKEGIFETAPKQFVWRMSKDTALDFYHDLENLLCQPEQSGSLVFEMLRLDEIKIKISMNEFDDSYLQD
ncbi:hypothetical protein [Acinetobacter baumannii]|uniref:hypothetical protein n=1 Tax=Acinetobacter baumannii TaxID=470 RepID=UPI00233F8301|nr:hypothetical protein [Acinetobacter baumannii]